MFAIGDKALSSEGKDSCGGLNKLGGSPHLVIVTIRDNSNQLSVLFYAY